jgi:quinoprotein glucose dehydrogenase
MKRALVSAIGCFAVSAACAEAGWPHYGGDEGGLRHSPAAQITPQNVDDLVRAWTFSTGDVAKRPARAMARANLEATPILVGDRLLLCTPFNEVIALDPGSGREHWRFDPEIAVNVGYGNGFTCRGVAAWQDSAAPAGGSCSQRVFVGTNDARLIALDLSTGKPCEGFGEQGTVKIVSETPLIWPGEFQITSPAVTVGDIVVIGSSISDNARVAAPQGIVRAFDARSGELKWTWDAIPRTASDSVTQSWGDSWQSVGHANVWAPMSVDAKRGLIFLPTSSPSPDFFGGLRPGDNERANSVVALRAGDGTLVWSYQLVHHDVWDYDVPAQPTLATLDLSQGKRDVVIQGTKQGFVFVLDRDNGAPVFPVEEKAVPQDAVAGEGLSPTQPTPTHVPALVPQRITPQDAYGFLPSERSACRDAIAQARHEGLYTPPSLQGTLLYPFTGGGINWGGVAFDPQRQILYANTSRLLHKVTLFPAAEYQELRSKFPDKEVSPQTGAPFGMIREVLLSPLGLPCNPPPWGTLAAVDLKAGKILWQMPLGTTEEMAPLGLPLRFGTPTFGGPLTTAAGLVFIGATFDHYLRAFDAASGEELWQGRLPAAAIATPMSYEWQGRQYVVVAAGAHRDTSLEIGDSFVAFALPRAGESGPSLWSRTIDRPGGRFYSSVAAVIAAIVAALLVVMRMVLRRRQRAV